MKLRTRLYELEKQPPPGMPARSALVEESEVISSTYVGAREKFLARIAERGDSHRVRSVSYSKEENSAVGLVAVLHPDTSGG